MFAQYTRVLACLGALVPITLAVSIPHVLKRVPVKVTPLSPSAFTVQGELGPHLSKNASLYFPTNPKFAAANERWSAAVDPNFIVVMVSHFPKCWYPFGVPLSPRFCRPYPGVIEGHCH